MTIHSMRRTYNKQGIDVADVCPDPVEQFHLWFENARQSSPGDWFEANAMTVATADRAGLVSSRILLLKGFDQGCPMFFTNYLSQKGRQLADNPHASICFYWPHCEQQIRIEGTVEQTSAEASDQYFQSRPRGNQFGAIISQQSETIESRQWLETRLAAAQQQYGEDQPIPRPEHWGGYRLLPVRFEFWQGRADRLHDRILYRRSDTTQPWTIERLSP